MCRRGETRLVSAVSEPSANPVAPPEFFVVDLSRLLLDTVVHFDLYLPPDAGAAPVLYRHRDLEFSEEVRDRLVEHQVRELLVSAQQENLYHAYIEHNVGRALADPKLSLDQKSNVLYAASCDMIREFLANPMTDDMIPRTRRIAKNAIDYLRADPRAFASFLRTTAPTYSTHSHSVNVTMYTLQVALRAGIVDDQLLEDLGVGAFLHDIGKCRVPDRILKKPGKLDAAEWRIMKKHPVWGCQILALHGLWSPAVIAVTRDHHEKMDGSGYPFGKFANDLPDYVRMITIADVFDAISTTRVYKEGVPSFNALEIMKSEMTKQLDPRLFSIFVQMFVV